MDLGRSNGIDDCVAPTCLFGLVGWVMILFGTGAGFGLYNIFSKFDSGAMLSVWAIETEMRKRDIEIPFPQRDLPQRGGTLHAAFDRMSGC